MTWPDILIAVSTLALLVFLAPLITNRNSYVPRLTSGVFAVAVAGIALGLFSSGLLLGAAINAIDAVGWGLVFWMRGEKKEKK